ncbi:MFS transporter [Neobacillus sp. SAB-20_R2A]|uniref:MFS transporter n=1 Tax=Neobacillus sp. SAB-20_R2A TaxID=3120519 RepID=UPI003C6EA3AD
MNLSVAQETQLIRLLCFIVPFAVINSYMLNVALPDISVQFGITSSTSSWVVTVSGIISALGTLLYGKLADHFGIKNLATFGVLMFFSGSILCFLAPSYLLLIMGRVIQGIGVSSIPSLAMVIPARYINAERRGKALGMIASTMAFSGVIGPILGGILTGYFHWRYLFLFSMCIILALPFIRKWFPNVVHKQDGMIDISSAGLIAVFIISLMEAITLLNLWLLIVSICFFVFFLIRQKHSAHPFIPLDLFRNASYRHGIFMGALNTSTNFGVFLITPLLFNQVYGLKGHWIGLLLVPAAFISALLGKYGGFLADQKGSRYVLTISIMVLSVGFLLLSTSVGYASWSISICLILTEVGYIFMQPSLANWVSRNLPQEHSGIGMGVYSLSNFLSIAVCGAVITTVVEFDKLPPLNPLAASGQSGIYSNIYFGFFVLTLLNLLFLYKFMYRPERKLIDTFKQTKI